RWDMHHAVDSLGCLTRSPRPILRSTLPSPPSRPLLRLAPDEWSRLSLPGSPQFLVDPFQLFDLALELLQAPITLRQLLLKLCDPPVFRVLHHHTLPRQVSHPPARLFQGTSLCASVWKDSQSRVIMYSRNGLRKLVRCPADEAE